jgi:acetoin utilization protein AcuB
MMLRIGEVMTRFPIVVFPSTSVAEARTVAADCAIHHLLVDDGHHLVGVIGIADLEHSPDDDRVAEHMSAPVVTAPSSLTIDAAAEMMAARDLGCLAVVQDGRTVGLVTRGDLVRAGKSLAAVGGHVCSACGDSVRHQPKTRGTLLCAACIVRSREKLGRTDIGGEA